MIYPLQRLAKPAVYPGGVPADWLSLPALSASEEKLVALVAVFDREANYVDLLVEGDFTVDWGDGTVENFSTGVKAEHLYEYAAISPTTECSLGYRQVIVTVTPQVEQHITKFDLQQLTTLTAKKHTQWLSVRLSMPFGSTLVVGGSEVFHTLLRSLDIASIGAITSLKNLCAVCYSLIQINLPDTSNVVDFETMFYRCWSLKSVPLFDTSSGTNFLGMFLDCQNIESIPAFDFASGTDFTYVFYSTQSARRVSVTGITRSVDFADYGVTVPRNLSQSAIDEIFANLGTASPGATIDVRKNFGAASCNPAIAQAKGWTVVTA